MGDNIITIVSNQMPNCYKVLRKDCRINVDLFTIISLFPEIMPDEAGFPFYVSRFPFTKTTSELNWLQKVVYKKRINNTHREGTRRY